MSAFHCLRNLFRINRQHQHGRENLTIEPTTITKEAFYNTASSNGTRDPQADQSDPKISATYFSDSDRPLITSPETMSLPGKFATRQNIDKRELHKKLRAARIKCPEQHHSTYFIPLNKQAELITASVIEEEIRKDVECRCQDPRTCARWAHENAKQLFTILAYVKKGGWIYRLYKDRISDNDLPLELVEEGSTSVALKRKSDKTILRAFDTWDSDDLEEFVRVQWWVRVPKFNKNDLKCREFVKETVLPLTGMKGEGAPDEAIPQMRQAGFSTVTAYRIHPAHHNFWPVDSIPEDEQPRVAIKQLLEIDNEEEFEKERSILEKLDPYSHPHLIKLLATYRLNEHYHFIFPCAQANLRNFWEMREHPLFDIVTVRWSLRQMLGLASALRLIHTFETTIDLKPPGGFLLEDDAKLEVEKGEEKYGRHGDIKPENILWFKRTLDTKEVDGMGVLQITDFGLGRFHGRESRSNVDPKTVNATPTYEPPECKLEKPVSRAYDIWSIACLYLEFITWLLEGTKAIHKFGDARGERGEPLLVINDKKFTIVRDAILNDDNFFTILRDENNVRSAIVRDAVIQWVDRLHMHDKCSQVIHDLLDLVMNHLLKPYSSERINSLSLKNKMKTIMNKADLDLEYLLKPIPQAPSLPSPPPATSQRSSSKKAVRFSETWPTSPKLPK